jgi:ketosteroid isomerase-like protein
MAPSDQEIVRGAFEAFARGDLDAALELCDPQIVVRDPARTGATFDGPDGLRRFFEEWLENWEEYRSEPVEFIESGDEIFVRTVQTGRGKLSGIEINQDLFQVFRMRDGKFVEYRLYTDRDDALASMRTSE